MKKRLVCLAPVLLGLAFWVAGLGCWPLLQWSPLNCSHEYIDINSGRIRRQHLLLGLCVSDSVEESSVSRLLVEDGLAAPPAWRLVNTFSPLVHYSPHYRYHGAVSQIRKMEMMWQLVPFAPEAKRQMAHDVLTLWQDDTGYSAAGGYLAEVERLLSQTPKPRAVTKQDLPLVEAIMKRQYEHIR